MFKHEIFIENTKEQNFEGLNDGSLQYEELNHMYTMLK